MRWSVRGEGKTVHESESLPDAASLLALLVAGDRLPVVAALVLGERTIEGIASRAELSTRDVLRVLTRLESAGLTSVEGSDWTLHVDVLREAVSGNRWSSGDRAHDQPSAVDHAGPVASPQQAAVLRSFFRAGRLVRVPVQRTKRLVVLDRLARDFEPGVRYSEAEVNQKLLAYHSDYAALRRYLVDEDYLARENGVYWRTGGTVEL
ncbi:MAG: hypothetical protein QOG69_1150 [Actinomycetota bacterium]|jgi:hypothetical protein|nr:hypothetical protein [Actinomycetota bacterium]